MYLYAAILFVLLTHLMIIAVVMIASSLVAAVVMWVTRPNAKRRPARIPLRQTMMDGEEQAGHDSERPRAA